MEVDLNIGDVVTLKKVHPCGNRDWKVLRLGADIGLECVMCGRYILIPRPTLAHRLRRVNPIQAPGINGRLQYKDLWP